MARILHPTRKQLLQNQSAGVRSHVTRCPICRELQQLLRLCFPSGQIDLEAVPEELLARLAVVPTLASPKQPRPVVCGTVVFDSWTGMSASQLREAMPGIDRRLTLVAGPITLEVVAQRTLEGWEFTARAYCGKAATDEFVLSAGRRRITPGTQKCFYWRGRQAPRQLTLVAADCRIVFETILWRGATA